MHASYIGSFVVEAWLIIVNALWQVGKLTFCNIEGYGGMCSHDPSGRCKGAVDHMLSQMPGGRCPYPPGNVPGGGPGLDRYGHWVGTA